MSATHGRFVWYELMTTDTAAAQAFYGKVVGWGTQSADMPGMSYTLLMAGDAQVGGLMELPKEARAAGAPPMWMGYVAVDDVDAGAEKAKALGGRVDVPPQDIPGVGRFAIVADPQGASLALYRSANPAQDQPADPMAPGRIGWHELYAADWEADYPFYRGLFGWEKAEAIPMGEMGTYQLFSHGGSDIGGMMTKPPSVPAPFWLFYFNVAGIDAARERVASAGGQIVNGPMEVPGGAWIVQGLDPQGAMFALVGPRG
jgi:predicted enzyme related to lactoylglutathione lyase